MKINGIKTYNTNQKVLSNTSKDRLFQPCCEIKPSNLTAVQLKNHYLNTNNICFTSNNNNRELEKAFFETKDLNNNEFIKQIYPKLVKHLELENIAPKNINIIVTQEFPFGFFLETTGEVFINKNFVKNSKKKELCRTIAHELKHLKQYSLMYKAFGKENFAEIMCDSIYIAKYYSKKHKLNSYSETDKIIEKIKNDINHSPVYKKAGRFIKLTDSNITLAESYKEALLKYRDSDEDFDAYNNNLLEKEAFAEGKLMEMLYENSKKG